MAVRLSVLHAGRSLPPGRFLVLISLAGVKLRDQIKCVPERYNVRIPPSHSAEEWLFPMLKIY
jgi:hypothetical protein